MELKAGEATVRHWRASDAEELPQVANDRRIWLNLRDAFPHPYAIEDARRWLAVVEEMEPRTYFAIERDGRVAGGIGYTLKTDVERVGAEIGYWLGAEHWGHGIATEAVRAVTAYAFAAHPELRRIFAVPYASNAASARVLEKAGYTLEGILRESVVKDGQILDQFMYAALRREPAWMPPSDE